MPTDDVIFRIPHGVIAHLKPAVHAIGPTDTDLKFVGMPSFDRTPAVGHHAKEVIRMDEVVGGPTLQFLRCPAEILQELAVEELGLTRGIHGRHEPGNGIDDQAKTLFTRAQGFLDALPVVNIGPQGIPADYTALSVPPGERADMEPAVYAIGTTDTVLKVMGMPRFHRVSPRGRQARKVIRVNDIRSGPIFQFVERLATIIQALLIDEFEFSRGRRSINKAGNAIDDKAQTLFTRAQGLLGMF